MDELRVPLGVIFVVLITVNAMKLGHAKDSTSPPVAAICSFAMAMGGLIFVAWPWLAIGR